MVTVDEPMLMIFENHEKGVLKNFLTANRSTGAVGPRQQVTMALHVTRGMEFLAGNKVVHKDLVRAVPNQCGPAGGLPMFSSFLLLLLP